MTGDAGQRDGQTASASAHYEQPTVGGIPLYGVGRDSDGRLHALRGDDALCGVRCTGERARGWFSDRLPAACRNCTRLAGY